MPFIDRQQRFEELAACDCRHQIVINLEVASPRNVGNYSVPYKAQTKDGICITLKQAHKMVSHAPLQWTLRIFAESFSSSSLPHFRFVRYQWRGNSVIDNTFYFFRVKGFMCWTICFFFTDEAYFHFNGYIHCQTVLYGVLKPHVHCM